MDLVKLNNEISGMRPSARQAQVRVIHHLTRKADGLQKKKGSEEQVASNRRRADNYKQEALIDKILKPDEITKFSLQFDASLRDKVLNDVAIPSSAKAFARIASYPTMVKAVEEFRNKYPDWNKWLEKHLEKLGTGSRFGAKMKNGRVKAHVVQRQRVEEAVDTIRRAQMSWLHNTGKNKLKIKPEDNVEDENITDGAKVDQKTENNESENNSTVIQNKAEIIDESETSEPCNKSKATPKTSKKEEKSKIVDKNLKKLQTVVYEEIDENEPESDEVENDDESEDEDKKKLKTDKIIAGKRNLESKKNKFGSKDEEIESEDESQFKDSESEDESRFKDSESEDESQFKDSESEDESQFKDSESEDESQFKDSESEDESQFKDSTDDEPESLGEPDSEVVKKRLKKLLKKEKRKTKIVTPRGREVEVCKFADLLKRNEQTRKSESEEDSADSDENNSKTAEKGVDPFFVTRNNDFLRIATAKREEKPEEPVREGHKWGIEGCETWSGTRQERRARAFGRPAPKKFLKRGGYQNFNSQPFPNQREKTRDFLPSVPAKIVQDEPEKLHPSWAAKRKMNVSTAGFQGKKVKFEDSD